MGGVRMAGPQSPPRFIPASQPQNKPAPDHYSLSHQQTQLREHISRDPKLRLFKVYTDPGVSGAAASRPALDALMEDARQGKFKKLFVLRIDRLGRDLLCFCNWSERSFPTGSRLFLWPNPLAPTATPPPWPWKQVAMVFSQLDRSRLCQRMMEGRLRKLLEGKHASGPAPLGYRITRAREIEVDPAGADLVKRIFRWRYGRRSYHWIAKKLNDEGQKPPKGGRKFYAATIRFIIKNSAVYRGHAKYGRLVKGIHQPIL